MKKEYKKLEMPVSFGDYAIVILKGTKEEVIALLGEAHKEAEPLSEPAPCWYWAIGFDCGLQIVLSVYDPPGKINVAADLPESQHVLKHLNLLGINTSQKDVFDPSNVEQQHYYFQLMGKSCQLDSRFQLWRQDDNGNRFRMSVFSSYREALCAANFFDSTGHKQTYWVEQLS